MSQMSMDEILANPDAPASETAVEQMNVDERAALEDARAAQAPEPAEQDASEPAAESEPESSAAEEAEPAKDAGDDLSDIPESIRRTLERRPEDAENWRNLREIAKSSQRTAREAVEQAAKAASERAQLEAELAVLRAEQSRQRVQAEEAARAASMPDPDVDPSGYVRAAMAAERESLRAEMRSMQLDTFETQAKARHGAETVEAAFAWATTQANTDPAFAAQLSSAFDPWDFVVAEKARREVLASMGDDPAAYLEQVKREAAERALAEARAGNAASAEQATAAAVEREIAQRLPRSLAKTPGAGGQAVSDGYAGPTPMSQIVGPQQSG